MDDVHVNTNIQYGDWRHLFGPDTGMILPNLFIAISNFYCFDNTIVDRLELSLKTFTGLAVSTKKIVLSLNTEVFRQIMISKDNSTTRDLCITDCDLKIRHNLADGFPVYA